MQKLFWPVIILFTLTVLPAFAQVGGGDIVMKAGKAGDVTFSHEVHVSALGASCTTCHTKIYTTVEKHQKVTMAQMKKGKSCGTCHNGKKAFAISTKTCKNCHAKGGK